MHTQVCLVLAFMRLPPSSIVFSGLKGRLSGILTKQPYHWKRPAGTVKDFPEVLWPRSPTLRWAKSIIILTHTRYSLRLLKNVPITKFKLDKTRMTCVHACLCARAVGASGFGGRQDKRRRKHFLCITCNQRAEDNRLSRVPFHHHHLCRLLPFSRELKHVSGKKKKKKGRHRQ